LLVLGSLIIQPFDNLTSTLLMVRVFRICRLFRIIKRARGLRMLFKTLVLSLPALANISMLLLLVFFVFAVLGIKLFGKTADYLDGYDRFAELNRHANFESFGAAMLLLFRLATGENWNGVMHDCRGLSDFAVPYFISFLYIGVYLFLNLYVAAIIQNFSNSSQTIGDAGIDEHAIRTYRRKWRWFDPDITGYIALADLKPFLFALGEPLVPHGMPNFWLEVLMAQAFEHIHPQKGVPFRPLLMTLGIMALGHNSEYLTEPEKHGREGAVQSALSKSAGQRILKAMLRTKQRKAQLQRQRRMGIMNTQRSAAQDGAPFVPTSKMSPQSPFVSAENQRKWEAFIAGTHLNETDDERFERLRGRERSNSAPHVVLIEQVRIGPQLGIIAEQGVLQSPQHVHNAPPLSISDSLLGSTREAVASATAHVGSALSSLVGGLPMSPHRRTNVATLPSVADGDVVMHPSRGRGVVVGVNMSDTQLKPYTVRFDSGDSHHYSEASLRKFTRPDSASDLSTVPVHVGSAFSPHRRTNVATLPSVADGDVVMHPSRGRGVVVGVNMGDTQLKPYIVRFDSGDSHHYSEASLRKFTRPDSAAAVPTVRCADSAPVESGTPRTPTKATEGPGGAVVPSAIARSLNVSRAESAGIKKAVSFKL
jgi:hypothetical protein